MSSTTAAQPCPSWCEECWEVTPGVTKHTKRFNITTTWHPVLQRWDHRDVTLESHTGPGASDAYRRPAIYFNMQNAGPDEARRVVASLESALEIIERELEQQEQQELLRQESASR